MVYQRTALSSGQSLDNKRGNRFRSSLPECYEIADFFLLEVTLQQAFQTTAVSGLVAGHLMDGVVDGIQAVALSASSQIELALGCAKLADYLKYLLRSPCKAFP